MIEQMIKRSMVTLTAFMLCAGFLAMLTVLIGLTGSMAVALLGTVVIFGLLGVGLLLGVWAYRLRRR